MIGYGYYIIEYNYKDKRGHVRTRREMRGTFELTYKVYQKLYKMVKDKDPKAPIRNPRLLQVNWDEGEREISFKKELQEWRNMKSNTKK